MFIKILSRLWRLCLIATSFFCRRVPALGILFGGLLTAISMALAKPSELDGFALIWLILMITLLLLCFSFGKMKTTPNELREKFVYCGQRLLYGSLILFSTAIFELAGSSYGGALMSRDIPGFSILLVGVQALSVALFLAAVLSTRRAIFILNDVLWQMRDGSYYLPSGGEDTASTD